MGVGDLGSLVDEDDAFDVHTFPFLSDDLWKDVVWFSVGEAFSGVAVHLERKGTICCFFKILYAGRALLKKESVPFVVVKNTGPCTACLGAVFFLQAVIPSSPVCSVIIFIFVQYQVWKS